MRLLALETATESCSVALLIDGEVREEFVHAPRLQTQLILPMTERLLAEAGLSLTGLDAVAFSRGPGAFTGVRIATAVAQGLAFGADLPVVPVSSLQTTAQGVLRQHGEKQAVVVFDARMDEVYAAAFIERDGLMQAVSDELLASPADVPLSLSAGRWFGVGNGWTYRDKLPFLVDDCDVNGFPHACDLARLAVDVMSRGGAVPPEQGLPVYLRDAVWKKLPGR